MKKRLLVIGIILVGLLILGAVEGKPNSSQVRISSSIHRYGLGPLPLAIREHENQLTREHHAHR